MKRSSIKKFLFYFILIIALLLLSIVALFTVTEYRPDPLEPLEISDFGTNTVAPGDSIDLLTWNIGFAAQDDSRDFFMDGGSIGTSESKEDVLRNMEGILSLLQEQDCDIVMLQEVDLQAKRSFKINEVSFFAEALGGTSVFACNYDAIFVPLPLSSPIGQVTSGLQTLSKFSAEQGERISLPVSYSWPVRTCQLKRCLLKQEIPLEGTDQKLILINLHLEAYAEGDKKTAQNDQLHALVLEEYEKGNYVIAGGDFNQSIPGIDHSLYPVLNDEYFQAEPIDLSTLPEDFSYVTNDSSPTARLLNEPYNGDWSTTQLYVIDGFLVSPNVQVNTVESMKEEFRYSDHNPVKMNVTLLSE